MLRATCSARSSTPGESWQPGFRDIDDTILLAVPEALEVEVEREHATLEHASEASLAPILPLAVDDLSDVGGGLREKDSLILQGRTQMYVIMYVDRHLWRNNPPKKHSRLLRCHVSHWRDAIGLPA